MFEIQTSFIYSEIIVVYHWNFPLIEAYALLAFSTHVSLVVLICKSVAVWLCSEDMTCVSYHIDKTNLSIEAIN